MLYTKLWEIANEFFVTHHIYDFEPEFLRIESVDSSDLQRNLSTFRHSCIPVKPGQIHTANKLLTACYPKIELMEFYRLQIE